MYPVASWTQMSNYHNALRPATQFMIHVKNLRSSGVVQTTSGQLLSIIKKKLRSTNAINRLTLFVNPGVLLPAYNSQRAPFCTAMYRKLWICNWNPIICHKIGLLEISRIIFPTRPKYLWVAPPLPLRPTSPRLRLLNTVATPIPVTKASLERFFSCYFLI